MLSLLPMTSLPPYQLTVDGFTDDHFRVHAFTGRETLSDIYSFDIVATTRGADEIERLTPGLRVAFLWNVGQAQRAFYGILASVRLAGVDETSGSVKVQLRLVPRLWLLKRKRRTRIFQKQRVPDIVASVLREAGITTRWQLKRDYPVREYCTQYEETDYRFVQRLLAESAIYFYFPEGPAVEDAALPLGDAASAMGSLAGDAIGSLAGSAAGAIAGSVASAAAPVIPGDTVICGDDAAFYPPIGGDDPAALLTASAASFLPQAGAVLGDGVGAVLGAATGAGVAAIAAFSASPAPTLYYLSLQGTEASPIDKITRFALSNTVRSEHAHFRDYDPERPMLPLTSSAFSTEPFPPTALQVAAAAAGAAASVIASAAPGMVGDVAGVVADKANVLTGPKLEVYDHHGAFLFPKWGFTGDEADRILRQKRRRASVASGESGCPDLSPGHRFALADHPIAQLDRPYVVTTVEHQGEAYPQAGDRPQAVHLRLRVRAGDRDLRAAAAQAPERAGDRHRHRGGPPGRGDLRRPDGADQGAVPLGPAGQVQRQELLLDPHHAPLGRRRLGGAVHPADRDGGGGCVRGRGSRQAHGPRVTLQRDASVALPAAERQDAERVADAELTGRRGLQRALLRGPEERRASLRACAARSRRGGGAGSHAQGGAR